MTNKNIISCFFIIIVILNTSCEQEVTFDFNKPVRLCLNCILDPDSIITAKLTLSGTIKDNSTFSAVDDADILIYEDGSEIGSLTNTGEGNYQMDYYPKPLKEYTITVRHPRYENLSASTTVPQKPNVQHKSDTLEFNEQGRHYVLDVNFEIHDTPGTTNYWMYNKHTLHEMTYSGVSTFSINAPFIDDFNRVTDTDAKYGIKYWYYIRISDAGYEGKILRFNTWGKTDSYNCFLSADIHYDKYLKTSVKTHLNSENDLPFKEPLQIYSNIENGYGIFGSCATKNIKL